MLQDLYLKALHLEHPVEPRLLLENKLLQLHQEV
jgi:hypothetical protein